MLSSILIVAIISAKANEVCVPRSGPLPSASNVQHEVRVNANGIATIVIRSNPIHKQWPWHFMRTIELVPEQGAVISSHNSPAVLQGRSAEAAGYDDANSSFGVFQVTGVLAQQRYTVVVDITDPTAVPGCQKPETLRTALGTVETVKE